MPRPRRALTSQISAEGIDYVRRVVTSGNCIFNEIHSENDAGVDAMVQLVEREEATGSYLGLQIKSGRSFCRPHSCKIPADREHFEVWFQHWLPVVGVVYDPGEACAYWADISDLLRSHPGRVHHGPFTISFPKTPLNRFDETGFREHVLPAYLTGALPPVVARMVAGVFHSTKASLQGILNLAEEAACLLREPVADERARDATRCLRDIQALVHFADERGGRIVRESIGDGDRGMRIVWVDDELGTLSLDALKRRLEREFAITSLRTPDQMLERARNGLPAPDVILLDMIFTERAEDAFLAEGEQAPLGLRLLRLLRKGAIGREWQSVPVLLLSAGTRFLDLPDFAQDRLTEIVTKPVGSEDLSDRIRTVALRRLRYPRRDL